MHASMLIEASAYIGVFSVTKEQPMISMRRSDTQADDNAFRETPHAHPHAAMRARCCHLL